MWEQTKEDGVNGGRPMLPQSTARKTGRRGRNYRNHMFEACREREWLKQYELQR